MQRAFKSKTGQWIPHPDDRNVSAKMRHRFYISDEKCQICKNSSLRFTKSDNCMMCQRYKIELVRLGDADLTTWPSTIPEGLNNPKDLAEVRAMIAVLRDESRYMLNYEPCSQHGHIVLSDVSNGVKCLQCESTLTPIQQALKDGKPDYLSTSPCMGCGNVTFRKVDTKECIACGYTPHVAIHDEHSNKDNRATSDTIMMREAPDLVISKEDAEAYGLKVYRTGELCRRGHYGWRYISTGNCIDCLRMKDETQ